MLSFDEFCRPNIKKIRNRYQNFLIIRGIWMIIYNYSIENKIKQE